MGRLTVDISDGEHQMLRMRAVELGVTVKDFVLGQLRPALLSTKNDREEFRKLADAWEKRREEFTLNRGKKTFYEIIHEGHKW